MWDFNIDKQENDWKNQKDLFYQSQSKYNEKITKLNEEYQNGVVNAIETFCRLILEKSEYPFSFKKKIETIYSAQNKILAVEYDLPAPNDLPTLKDVKYFERLRETREYHFTENQIKKQYDSVVYMIVLRSLNEIFFNDSINAIDAISFNGSVTAINKTNGKIETKCLLSIYVKKDTFNEIDLKNVDPKQCFKGLKGISSASLSDLAAVQPILQINKNDKRIIESKEVSFNEGTNLASMNWDDFEHLVRELFEREFKQNGGEVKVTQASRDGGVDAIAFDPDPIRGGKIIIQAKRYTNTVGVSAVRDLYGTLINEGATKGILITTSDYGNDSYEFAKGKPITLLNGGHLLYLLEKHGQKARIDIHEAKLMNETPKNNNGI